ncbi:MAG: hypothetical protein JWO51_4031 [Rhodospirillales bacterium]|nr:hypothetical protein [Rhodospirillales bacterium]
MRSGWFIVTGAALLGLAMPPFALAYTSAGDRIFPATLLLPQIAPTDEAYLTGTTQPVAGGRNSGLTANYAKTITPQLAIDLAGGYNWASPTTGPEQSGWQNTAVSATWEIWDSPGDEFLVSTSLEREFGATGTVHAGANSRGATTGFLFFGKGFGTAASDIVKPFAIAGALGYQLGDTSGRPDVLQAGVVLEYSLPYFAAAVSDRALPDWVAKLTPMLEVWTTTPVQHRTGAATTVLFGPGLGYASEGWEIGVEALLPATRGTGQGAGATLQLHLALDYLTPGLLGRPIF